MSLRDRDISDRASNDVVEGRRVMSTVIHFECRNPAHLAARSRDGVGGMVMRHGTLGYCDGAAYDADHRWVPTGGVPLEFLIRDAHGEADDDDRYPRAGHVPHDIGNAGPLPTRG